MSFSDKPKPDVLLIPQEQVADEAWRRLSRAADDPADAFRILTLCTVTPEGRPAGRVMLLRGADRASRRIWCHSRRESPKIADLRTNPFFAAVAYDAADSIQIRLSGSAEIHELDNTAMSHFEQSLRAKRSGQMPAAALPDPVWPGSDESLVHLSKRASRQHFAVIEMLVEAIDWTQVIGDRVTNVRVDAATQ